MIPASPGFQPDRSGAPGFQLAEHGGFQTQTPAQVGALDVRVGLSSPALHGEYLPSHAGVGDLQVAVGLASPSAYGHAPPAGPSWGSGILLRPGHTYTGALGVVVGLASPSRFSTAIERDDEDVFLLLMASTRARAQPASARSDRAARLELIEREHAAWLELIEADDRLVEALRRCRENGE